VESRRGLDAGDAGGHSFQNGGMRFGIPELPEYCEVCGVEIGPDGFCSYECPIYEYENDVSPFARVVIIERD